MTSGFQDISPLGRRAFLHTAGGGFGMLALQSLLAKETRINPWAPRPAPFAPRARSVIFLFMYGGPSQVDTFDPQPALDEWHGR